jgi:hypothetical protein
VGFVNPILGGGGALVRPAIKSPNYVAGSAGWSINRDGSAEFSTGTFRGALVGSSFQTATSGRRIEINVGGSQSMELFDSSGNVLLSVGDQAGVITSYDAADGTHALDVGASRLTFYTAGGGGLLTPAASLRNVAGAVILDTQLAGGVALDTARGALVATVPGSDSLRTWQALTMQGGWASGSSLAGTWPALLYRRDTQNNIIVHGTFKATSTTPGTIIASGLPAVSFAHTGGESVGHAVKLNANGVVLPVYLNDTGQLRINTLPTTAVGDTYLINVAFPLGGVA